MGLAGACWRQAGLLLCPRPPGRASPRGSSWVPLCGRAAHQIGQGLPGKDLAFCSQGFFLSPAHSAMLAGRASCARPGARAWRHHGKGDRLLPPIRGMSYAVTRHAGQQWQVRARGVGAPGGTRSLPEGAGWWLGMVRGDDTARHAILACLEGGVGRSRRVPRGRSEVARDSGQVRQHPPSCLGTDGRRHTPGLAVPWLCTPPRSVVPLESLRREPLIGPDGSYARAQQLGRPG